MPAVLILARARTSRLAIVGSGTRNARAISSVSSPPRVRRVSATWASSASAGWQQVKMSSSRSSGISSSLSTVSSTALGHLEQAGLGREGAVAPDAVDRPVAGRGHEPGVGVGRHAVARPAGGGDGERLLGGFLGELEVAEEADQGRHDAAPLLTEDGVEA